MKRLFTLTLVSSLFIFQSRAQYADVSLEFQDIIIQAFPAEAPGIFNGSLQMDTTAAFVTTLRHMDIHGLTQTSEFSLLGIQYFDALTYLNCADNSVSSLSRLPPNLDTLICSGQISTDFINPFCLQSLSTLPGTLRYLDCSGNGLNSLPNLPPGLLWLNCASNLQAIGAGFSYIPTLYNLPVLPASLEFLNCSGNGLTSLPELPSNLLILNCASNKYIFDDGSGNPFEVGGISCLPALPLSLQTLYAATNNLTCLYNAVPGLATDIPLPVCNAVNNPNNCPVYTAPSITAGPDINNLAATGGQASNSASYTIAGTDLSPVAGNIIVTPSTNLEISADNINFSALPLVLTYSGGQLPSTDIYVRISAGTTGGSFAGSISNSGGGATTVVVNVNGSVARIYYNTKANLGLNNPATWSISIDGTGSSPINLTDDSLLLNIIDQANANYTGSWNSPGAHSRVVIGDGTSPLTFTVPAGPGNTFTGNIDVKNNAVLKILNLNLPNINSLAEGSTVEFAETENYDIIIPPISYFNLTLRSGNKYFSPGLTVIRNDLLVDGVSNFGKGDTLNCFGNVSFINGTQFTSSQAGIKLKMNGADPSQSITTDGSVIKLCSLERDSLSNTLITISPNAEVELGNAEGGGLRFKSSTLAMTGGKISLVESARGPYFSGGAEMNTNGTSIKLLSTGLGGNYPASLPPGFRALRFAPNSTVSTFTMDFLTNNSVDFDHIDLSNNFNISDSLILRSGRIVYGYGVTINLLPSAVVVGGSKTSFIDGSLKRTGTTNLLFPVGNGYLSYRPVEISNLAGSNSYTVKYKRQNYPDHTIDPTTLASYPDYTISGLEYWDITPQLPGGAADLTFHYTDQESLITSADQLRIAHFDGTDWNDLGGADDPLNTPDSGKVTVTGVSTLDLFTFSTISGVVVPINLSEFSVSKEDKSVQLSWTTEQEINSKEFIIERSPDQQRWSSLSHVNAAVNSSQKVNYTSTDFDPATGVNYYRLRQVNLDGRFNYSEIRSVYFGDNLKIMIAPNPAKDKVIIYLPGNKEKISITLYNSNGQVVKTASAHEEMVEINLSGLAKGIYSIKLSGKNLDDVKKLLVE